MLTSLNYQHDHAGCLTCLIYQNNFKWKVRGTRVILNINMIRFFNMFKLSEQFLNEIICQAHWLSLQTIKTFFKAIQLSLLGSITFLIATTRLSSPSFNSHHAITVHPAFNDRGQSKHFVETYLKLRRLCRFKAFM